MRLGRLFFEAFPFALEPRGEGIRNWYRDLENLPEHPFGTKSLCLPPGSNCEGILDKLTCRSMILTLITGTSSRIAGVENIITPSNEVNILHFPTNDEKMYSERLSGDKWIENFDMAPKYVVRHLSSFTAQDYHRTSFLGHVYN